MSLLPFFVESELRPRRRLLDQHFGLGLTADDMLSSVEAPLALFTPDYYRPWRQLAMVARDLGSTVTNDKDKFQMKLDVEQFSPEEISVKTSDGYVVVEGKHEEKKDEHGFVSRKFVRRYALPPDCEVDKLESNLSSDGVLTVVAPKKPSAITNERTVNIEKTGPVRKQKEIKQGKEVKEKPQ